MRAAWQRQWKPSTTDRAAASATITRQRRYRGIGVGGQYPYVRHGAVTRLALLGFNRAAGKAPGSAVDSSGRVTIFFRIDEPRPRPCHVAGANSADVLQVRSNISTWCRATQTGPGRHGNFDSRSMACGSGVHVDPPPPFCRGMLEVAVTGWICLVPAPRRYVRSEPAGRRRNLRRDVTWPWPWLIDPEKIVTRPLESTLTRAFSQPPRLKRAAPGGVTAPCRTYGYRPLRRCRR